VAESAKLLEVKNPAEGRFATKREFLRKFIGKAACSEVVGRLEVHAAIARATRKPGKAKGKHGHLSQYGCS